MDELSLHVRGGRDDRAPACPECGAELTALAERGRSAVDPFTGAVAPEFLALFFDKVRALALRYGRRVGLLHVRLDGLDERLDAMPRTARRVAMREVAARLEAAVRDSDVVGRAAGGFDVVLGDLWEPDVVGLVAARVVSRFRRPLAAGADRIELRPRVGVALFPDDADGLPELRRRAAAAAAAARSPGVGYHDPALARAATRTRTLERGLRQRDVLERFELHYQPIISMADGAAVGMEALARWNRPDGRLPAGDFIRLAEQTGRVVTLDRWAVRSAVRQAREWADSGWDGWTSVNLSGRTLCTPGIARFVADELARAQLEPRALVVEVTESAALLAPERATAALRDLKDVGVYVAVDDFGTGYSSFGYLRDFIVDLVKLDGSFLDRVRDDPAQARLMEGLILMAHHLGKPVVAEGCEDEAQRDWLGAAGCDLVQGWLLGRPMPAADARAFLGRD